MFIRCALLAMFIFFPSMGMALEKKSEPRAKVPYLEKKYAEYRKRHISDVQYELYFDVSSNGNFIKGKAKISFLLLSESDFITLDFSGGPVELLTINGRKADWTSNDWFIEIPGSELKLGNNQIEVHYSAEYSINSHGVKSYVDEKTKSKYLFGHFEPYGAHYLFPSFDQPDLKGKIKLTVKAPASWNVISAMPLDSIAKQDLVNVWRFGESDPIPTYAFSLYAGNYEYQTSSVNGIPIRLFYRKEVAGKINSKEWFTFTEQALSFYQNYFSVKFPLKKYDQVIVPDYSVSAMENVGAASFSESWIENGEGTYFSKMRLSNVISHELAHAWFGNLVTMRWWDDLWLNESFATYMSYHQQATNSDFSKDAWSKFNEETRSWAYEEDVKVNSKSVAADVKNTEEAESAFNGVTYAKGAILLGQLSNYVGEDEFRNGVNSYLTKYKYANANAEEFFPEISLSSGISLKKWSHSWFRTPGLNTISIDYTCRNGRLKSINVSQTAPEWSVIYRSQKIDIGLFELNDNFVDLKNRISIIYEGKNSKTRIKSDDKCPDFILPNIGDKGYVRSDIDIESNNFLLKNISKFEDKYRSILWQLLWDEVKQGELSIFDYLSTVNRDLQKENNPKIIRLVLDNVKNADEYLALMLFYQTPKFDFTTPEEIINSLFRRQNLGNEFKQIIFPYLIMLSRSDSNLKKLKEFLNGDNVPEWLTLYPMYRWLITVKLNRHLYEDYDSILKREKLADKTPIAMIMSEVGEASQSDSSVKRKWLRRMTQLKSEYSDETLQRVMLALFPPGDVSLRNSLEYEIEQTLEILMISRDEAFVSNYVRAMYRAGCDIAYEENIKKLLQKYKNNHLNIISPLQNGLVETVRCRKMFDKSFAESF